MKITILTTITNPEKRQDPWLESLKSYADVADEIVIVNGGEPFDESILIKNAYGPAYKIVNLPWGKEWNWIELPKHLNYGLDVATGDWIIKMDIDQMFHEDEIPFIRSTFEEIPEGYDSATFQKFTFTYAGRKFEKGGMQIAFRNKPYIRIGEKIGVKTDLCFPIKIVDTREVEGYSLPVGVSIPMVKTALHYLNYDYFFKTKGFTKNEFWRFSKAYHRYFKEWKFGSSKEKAFEKFLNMQESRHLSAPYITTLSDHPKYIRDKVNNLNPRQFGHSAWGLLEVKNG